MQNSALEVGKPTIITESHPLTRQNNHVTTEQMASGVSGYSLRVGTAPTQPFHPQTHVEFQPGPLASDHEAVLTDKM